MHTLKAGVATLAVLVGAPAAAADFAVIKQELIVDRPAETVWAKVGADYCGLGQWMRVKCEYASGGGELGTVRRMQRLERLRQRPDGHRVESVAPLRPVQPHHGRARRLGLQHHVPVRLDAQLDKGGGDRFAHARLQPVRRRVSAVAAALSSAPGP